MRFQSGALSLLSFPCWLAPGAASRQRPRCEGSRRDRGIRGWFWARARFPGRSCVRISSLSCKNNNLDIVPFCCSVVAFRRANTLGVYVSVTPMKSSGPVTVSCFQTVACLVSITTCFVSYQPSAVTNRYPCIEIISLDKRPITPPSYESSSVLNVLFFFQISFMMTYDYKNPSYIIESKESEILTLSQRVFVDFGALPSAKWGWFFQRSGLERPDAIYCLMVAPHITIGWLWRSSSFSILHFAWMRRR